MVGAFTLVFALPSSGASLHGDRAVQIMDHPFYTFGRSVSASLAIAARPEVVYATLTDYRHMPEFLPMVDETTLLGVTNGVAQVRFRIRCLNLFNLEEVDERTFEKNRMIRWHGIRGPLKISDGQWTLAPERDGTRLNYQTSVDPGFPLPSMLTGFLVKQGLPEFLEAVRRRAESGGTWCKQPNG
jgi:ribosome-associated toxin RatA of RatAB toxin-antitoxin module